MILGTFYLTCTLTSADIIIMLAYEAQSTQILAFQLPFSDPSFVQTIASKLMTSMKVKERCGFTILWKPFAFVN